MKNQIFKIVLVSFLSLCFFSTAYADTAVHLSIETDSGYIYNQNINVVPCDNDGTVAITAYCALAQSGIASDWSGLWTNSINGIINNANGNGIYWMWLANLNTNNPYSDFNCHQDAPYGCSAKQYILNSNDNILFFYSLSQNPPVFSTISGGGPLLTYTAPVATTTTPPASVTVAPAITPPTPAPAILAKPNFDLKKAFDFLTSQQKSDGSFGSDLYTDWTALALASGNNQDQTIKLIKYFGNSKIENASVTDYERRAMALMALGLNPCDTNGENYIEKITSSFDSKQFGDINHDNDDIFALIVLQNAGYSQADKMISDDISFVLGAQNANGSWDNSVDMTGAAIEALSTFSPNPGLGESLKKAENFLKQNQKDNGSWNNNASSTAWALEGILALNEKPEDWIKNSNTSFDYLATTQDTDGGIKDASMNNKIWETSYVVSALSGKTWNQIMQKFEKLIPPTTTETPKKITKIQKSKLETTASVINAVTNTPTPPATNLTENPAPKKNWFTRLLDNIFGGF